MPRWDMSFSFERLKEHRALIEGAQGTNEATTRLRAIDTMLFDVLGWDELDVEPEKYCRSEGYADYALTNGASVCLTVEAKKSAETFVLPTVEYSSAPIGLPLISKECPAADSALRQAPGYAASTGARYIAITNGFQWLLTLTFVADQNVTERSVYVFESVDAIEKRFRLFWDCFSQQGLSNNRAANFLLETRKAPPPTKLSQRIAVYPAPANRNRIADGLSTVLGVVWDEIRYEEEGEEFLSQCYVEPEVTTGSIAQARELLERKLSADEKMRTIVIKPSEVAQILPDPSPEKPIVILGRVGHGKSTFLRYLRIIKARDLFDKYIQLQIDFLDRPGSQAEVGAFVYGKVERQLREEYGVEITDNAFVKGVLHSDLARFGRSSEGQAFPKESPEYKREELSFIKSVKEEAHDPGPVPSLTPSKILK